MFPWFKFVELGLQIVLKISQVMQTKMNMDAGKAVVIAQSLSDIADTLGITEVAKAKFAHATEAEIDERLKEIYRD